MNVVNKVSTRGASEVPAKLIKPNQRSQASHTNGVALACRAVGISTATKQLSYLEKWSIFIETTVQGLTSPNNYYLWTCSGPPNAPSSTPSP